MPIWAGRYWAAFFDLTNDRHFVTEMQMIPIPGGTPFPLVSSRPLPIPWGVLKAYADHNEMHGEDFTLFVRFMRSMDTEYLTILSEQRKQQQEANG